MKEQKRKAIPIYLKASITGLISLCALVSFLVVLIKLCGKYYDILVDILTSRYGLLGISLYDYICESFILPLPTNICFAFVTGLSVWKVLLVLGVPGVLGSVTAYLYGRWLTYIPFIGHQADSINAKWGESIRKYGYWIMLSAGIIPLSFTTICVAAGIVKLDPKKTISCIMIRLLRTVLYYYAFRFGLIALS